MGHRLLVFFFEDFFFLLNYLETSELGLVHPVSFNLGGHKLMWLCIALYFTVDCNRLRGSLAVRILVASSYGQGLTIRKILGGIAILTACLSVISG